MTITIGWEYFLGIVAGLIAVAWYSGSRFSSIETSITWIKDNISKLEGKVGDLFASSSPITLMTKGNLILETSGLKDYIDSNKKDLLKECCNNKSLSNPYDIQEAAFKFFDGKNFDEFEDDLKKAAFTHGVSLEVVKRIGGIYFRDILLNEFNYKPEDLDKPKKTK